MIVGMPDNADTDTDVAAATGEADRGQQWDAAHERIHDMSPFDE